MRPSVYPVFLQSTKVISQYEVDHPENSHLDIWAYTNLVPLIDRFLQPGNGETPVPSV
jgi:hypothetical protein